MDSDFSSQRQGDNKSEDDKNQTNKLFISNIDGKSDIRQVETKLRQLFQNCGSVDSVAAKKSRNQEYCFAFVEMKNHLDAENCIKNYNKTNFEGRKIIVQLQDVSKCHRGRKEVGCYNCGKIGHFARECPNSRENGGKKRHRRSRSSDSEDSYRRRHKKHKIHKRKRSYSSDSSRSHSARKKKSRKHHSRDRREKRKRKHRQSYSSDS